MNKSNHKGRRGADDARSTGPGRFYSIFEVAEMVGVVTRHTTERLGIRVTPHDARDAAATLWAIMAPGQIGVAGDLLAHERLTTTNKYYNRARGIEASRRQARLIAKIRKGKYAEVN